MRVRACVCVHLCARGSQQQHGSEHKAPFAHFHRWRHLYTRTGAHALGSWMSLDELVTLRARQPHPM